MTAWQVLSEYVLPFTDVKKPAPWGVLGSWQTRRFLHFWSVYIVLRTEMYSSAPHGVSLVQTRSEYFVGFTDS